jgi:hypothetical protein
MPLQTETLATLAPRTPIPAAPVGFLARRLHLVAEMALPLLATTAAIVVAAHLHLASCFNNAATKLAKNCFNSVVMLPSTAVMLKK